MYVCTYILGTRYDSGIVFGQITYTSRCWDIAPTVQIQIGLEAKQNKAYLKVSTINKQQTQTWSP